MVIGMNEGSEPLVMSGKEAEVFVIALLKARGPLTTMQIIFLTKMKRKGLIKGEASVEKRGWLWWVP